jgi:hypothetical protein
LTCGGRAGYMAGNKAAWLVGGGIPRDEGTAQRMWGCPSQRVALRLIWYF